MYDISNKFNTFYKNNVVLSNNEQSKLYDKKRINLKRLKEGLSEYNNENNTEYKLVETITQGSLDMHTIVQNENNDYDIDVAIIFDNEYIKDIGPLAMRNIVANSIGKKTKQFNAEPEVKTSCVRIKYNDGYHIDLAVFKREEYYGNIHKYQHAGSDWSYRSVRDLKEWFDNSITNKGENLVKVIRLLKMFVKSRENWVNMPSGLILSILCEENISQYTRIDEMFYYTMQSIVKRLEDRIDVYAPVDNNRKLTIRNSDIDKMNNLKNRLENELNKLDVIFTVDCTELQAINAWNDFFCHKYWKLELDKILKNNNQLSNRNYNLTFDDTEQYIHKLFKVEEKYKIDIKCSVSGNGINGWKLIKLYNEIYGRFIAKNLKIKCEIIFGENFNHDTIYWKVKNVGEYAIKKNCVRGQIFKGTKEIIEHSSFKGEHYIECYIIKDDICIASANIAIPI